MAQSKTYPVSFTPEQLASEAKKNFAGWHYTGSGIVQRTALAIIPNTGPVFEQFRQGRDALEARSNADKTANKHVYDLRTQKPDCMTLYVRTLNNNGITLQSKEDNMTLTRPLRVVVKGASVAHVATLCDVRSFAVTTSAHDLVEHAAVRAIIDEAKKRGTAPPGTPDCLLRKLVGTTKARHGCQNRQQTHAMKMLEAAPHFATIFKLCGENTNVNPCVLLTQTTAVIVTSYEDAGTRFRDRSSRIEAARHHAMAVDSVLMLPVLHTR